MEGGGFLAGCAVAYRSGPCVRRVNSAGCGLAGAARLRRLLVVVGDTLTRGRGRQLQEEECMPQVDHEPTSERETSREKSLHGRSSFPFSAAAEIKNYEKKSLILTFKMFVRLIFNVILT